MAKNIKIEIRIPIELRDKLKQVCPDNLSAFVRRVLRQAVETGFVTTHIDPQRFCTICHKQPKRKNKSNCLACHRQNMRDLRNPKPRYTEVRTNSDGEEY